MPIASKPTQRNQSENREKKSDIKRLQNLSRHSAKSRPPSLARLHSLIFRHILFLLFARIYTRFLLALVVPFDDIAFLALHGQASSEKARSREVLKFFIFFSTMGVGSSSSHSKREESESHLRKAIEVGDVQIVYDIVTRWGKVEGFIDSRGELNRTPLHLAVLFDW